LLALNPQYKANPDDVKTGALLILKDNAGTQSLSDYLKEHTDDPQAFSLNISMRLKTINSSMFDGRVYVNTQVCCYLGVGLGGLDAVCEIVVDFFQNLVEDNYIIEITAV
jgi:hypothetical protein